MAITFGVASTSGTTAMTGLSGDGTLTTPLPTSWAAGQLAILVIYLDQGTASTPTNWTSISGNPFGSGTEKLYIFRRFLQAGDADPASTISGSGTNLSSVGAIATYNSVDTTTPIEVIGTASAGTGTPMTAGGITTLTNGAWALGCCGRGDNESSSGQTFNSSATGVAERFDSGTSAGNDSQVSLYDKAIATAGATGDGSSTTSATDPWVSVIIALKPFTVSLPTVTTQAASSVAEETATGNGNITATGGENCDTHGIVYSTSTHGAPGNVAPASSGYESVASSSGSYGTGAFTDSLTSLAPATQYYARAYAHNSAGYAYGDEVNFTTVDWAIRLAASTNITASGENTTAQLTAPSGKTTSNFTTGRMQDDENPADSIDIAADNYTELEWCIKATSVATADQVYEFRVTSAGTALNTYTVTPQWTIVVNADKTGSDSGTLSEASALAAELSGTDSATLTDSSSVDSSTQISGTDSGTLSETSVLDEEIPAADSATLNESSAIAADLSGTDSATLTDSSTLDTGTPIAGTDSGILSESSTIEAALSSTDSGTLSDAGSVNTGTSNHTVSVGDGYTDVTPRQVVRTSDNRLYVSSWKFDTYPHGGIGGGNYNTQTLRMYRADQVGVPATFTRLDQANEPAGVVSWSMAIDGNDQIHVVWTVRATWSTDTGVDNIVRYCVFDTNDDTWGAVETIETAAAISETGQGDELCAIAIDGSNVPHIVYLKSDGTRRRVNYRNRSGGSWSSATIVDDQSFGANQKCWHPGICFDGAGRIVVTWLRGAFELSDDGRIFVRTYSGGAWGTTHDVVGANVYVGIDTGTPVFIDANNRYHICYLTTSATKYAQYRFSDDQGSTWTANHPGGGTAVGDDPTPGPGANGKVRIYKHGLAADSYPIVYYEGDGGSAAWGSATTYSNTVTPNDCSVNVRWTQYWWNYPSTRDVAFWQSNYPTNALYIGTDVDATDLYGVDSATLAESSELVKGFASTDSGTLAEASVIAATLSSTDAFTFSEVTGVLTAIVRSGTDSGTFAESSSLAAGAPATDSGTLAESSALAAALSGTDSGTLAESSTVDITEFATVAGSDSFTFSESSSLTVVVSSTEPFTFGEAGAIAADLSGADAGTLAIESSALNTGESPGGVDLFVLSETSTISVTLASVEAFTFVDAGAIAVTLAGTDTFTFVDAGLLTYGRMLRDEIAIGVTIDRAREFDVTIDQARGFNLEF